MTPFFIPCVDVVEAFGLGMEPLHLSSYRITSLTTTFLEAKKIPRTEARGERYLEIGKPSLMRLATDAANLGL